MKKTKLFFVMAFIACSLCTATTHAEEIALQNMSTVTPIDESDDLIWATGDTPNHIVAHFDGNTVKVDFKKPVGNVQITINRGNGFMYKQIHGSNPQSLQVDMNGAETGRYLLEVYTDTEAVGGVFEVK